MTVFSRKYRTLLLRFAATKRSAAYKLTSLAAGALLFLVLMPAAFYQIARLIRPVVTIQFPSGLETAVCLLCVPLGLGITLWSAITQWRNGGGTPAPTAPTQRLVVSGPYARCRNPIELGAIIYYLGIGTAAGSLTHGAICALLAFIVGTLFHKYIEEHELELRFGRDYEEYKARTPFLIPRLWRRPDRAEKPGPVGAAKGSRR